MITQVDKKITSYKVKGTEEKTESQTETKVISTPYIRPFKLTATSYKIKPGAVNESFYITITDRETLVDGKLVLKPFEIFINSRNVEHFEWVTLITRLTSAIFRTVDNPTFVIDEFKSIHSPKGGYWGKVKEPDSTKRTFYKSILDEIGAVIEFHFEQNKTITVKTSAVGVTEVELGTTQEMQGKFCSICNSNSIFKMDGCDTCTSCGWSKCG